MSLSDYVRFPGALVVPIADVATPTVLDRDKAIARVLILTGALTGTRTFLLLAKPGADWYIVNATTGGHAVNVGSATSQVAVPSGQSLTVITTDGVAFVSPAAAATPSAVIVDVQTAAGPYTPARAAWRMVYVNQTVGAAYTFNLPASPNDGDILGIYDGKGDAGTNAVTVNGNGHNIIVSKSGGSVSSFPIHTNYDGGLVIFVAALGVWRSTAAVP